MFTIRSSFIGSFKLGDNINHNLDVLALLYRHHDASTQQERRLLCKPIILLLVSIIEAVLHDFHGRIKLFTVEGVRNLPGEVIAHIRFVKIDQFGKYIVSARKHDFFDLADSEFYDRLDELRRLRNRIHIQNTKRDFEPDEINAFNSDRKWLAESVLEKTLRTMAAKFARNHDHVRDFELPWEPQFPDGDA